MDKVRYKEKEYDVVTTIRFSGTIHLIIKNNEDILYVNEVNGKYVIPPKDLSLINNLDTPLPYIRKQHLLSYLTSFLKERNIDDDKILNKIITTFKKYINESNIERFLYWPLLNDAEFNMELNDILKDLEYELEQVLNSKESNQDYVEIKLNNIEK